MLNSRRSELFHEVTDVEIDGIMGRLRLAHDCATIIQMLGEPSGRITSPTLPKDFGDNIKEILISEQLSKVVDLQIVITDDSYPQFAIAPKEKEGAFSTISPVETEIISQQLRGAITISDVVGIMGQPDKYYSFQGGMTVQKKLVYQQLCHSSIVIIFENSDGSIDLRFNKRCNLHEPMPQQM